MKNQKPEAKNQKPETRSPKPVIMFSRVSKLYRLRQQRTLKELLPALFKRRAKDTSDGDPKGLLRGGGVSKDLWALKDVSFQIKKGETVGIIGPNGAGKSTILKLIAGVTKPTKGKITVNGRVSPLIELGAGFHPDLTGRENIYLNGAILGLPKKEIDKKFKEIVDFAELWDFIDQPVKHYSSGMYMRLGFSIAVSVQPEILLIDEILAVGDTAFQEKCLDKMRDFQAQGVTIVFVSHSLETVKTFCQKAVLLKNGKVRSEGSPDKVVADYTGAILEKTKKEQTAEGKGIITKVEFLRNGGSAYLFQTEDKFVARIYYSVKKPIKKPVFGIAIYRDDGTHIAGPNTKASGIKFDKIKGRGVIDYVIKKLPLKNGRYLFTVGLFDWSCQRAFDFKDKAFEFKIRGGKQDTPYGLLKLKDDWNTKE